MITNINDFRILLEGKKSDKQYKKEVALYKFFVVNTKTKKVESGWEFKDDAKDALSDFDGDKDYKVLSELQLKKLGIDNPKQKWINESNDSVRAMSLTVPEQKNWIEKGENLGIKYMGKTYWIKPNDKSFFEENIGNSIKFKYSLDSMYIEFPTLLKAANINEDLYDNMDQSFIKVKELMNKTIEFLKVNEIPVLKVEEPTYDYDGTIDITDHLSINCTLDLKLSLTIENTDNDTFIITTPTANLRKILKNIKEYL